MLADSDFRAPALDSVDDPILRDANVQLRLLRLDQIHPLISGNKWYKLKHNLIAAKANGTPAVLSFGGAYSNHLVALAAASKASGLRSIGIVRGETPQTLNPALRFAQQQGMTLHFVSRSEYRSKQEASFLQSLQTRFGPCYVIPEGGSNLLGIKGCAEIAEHLGWSSTGALRFVVMACGTAATLAGVVSRLPADCEAIGISVLKGQDTLSPQVEAWLQTLVCRPAAKWTIDTRYHHGGYAKHSAELIAFIEAFTMRTGIPLEPVYTGKMMWGLYKMIASTEIPAGSEVIALHTGGLVTGL